ncbi:vacuolar ATP synthase subunit E, putative [Entamoeba invadens IP1]|uniref:Vacuolar ATP synthase subunit E, putative n=1 Tax=Entamoeba invadens IP1 TaxID=370355 RepID=A0A0A1TXN6_ENTIV|nr:vacuolar ATP synthase subunit E, putative [Entamoeba invadens IP1]ELP84300.1 vacuolar ATP synthase subunit E, putative [Entamoeba invadens IP1]|eukprot:XP_004183646.1 vacuolar ATP synthase subunit E, putative [Entamoeba invadens IP1]
MAEQQTSQAPRQLLQMVKFIEFEANSKRQEIQSNAEQECERDKASFIEKERKKIEADYIHKVKEAEVKKKIAFSQELSASRLKLLESEDKHIEDLMTLVKDKLQKQILNEDYNDLLVKLIKEGVKKVEDKKVTIMCIKNDLEKVKKAIDIVTKEDNSIKITLDQTHFLDQTAIGGVAVASMGDKIVCYNTLEHRMNSALMISLPQVRVTVFPSLKTRKQKN